MPSKPRPAKRAKRKTPSKRKAKAQPSAVLVRTSEFSSYKTCRWMWDRGWNDRLKPIQESPALRFGSLVHEALEVRYPPGIKRGPKPAETFEQLFQKERKYAEERWKMRVEGDWDDALELGIDMLEGYVEKYGRDEDWKVIASEMTFQVPVYIDDAMRESPLIKAMAEAADIERDVWTGMKPLFYYVGTMDGVWENRMDGRVRINDYKTTAGDPTKEALSKSILDEQATAYWTWGCDHLITEKILKPRQIAALDGMLYTFLRKARRDTRPLNADGLALNKDGTVSKKQPIPRFHREVVYRSEVERERARERAVLVFLEMAGCRSGTQPIYKTPATGSMGHCGFCPFRDICELHESGADWELLRDSTMSTWDPYDAHEIEDEGKRR